MKSNPLSLEEVSKSPVRFIYHCLKINAVFDSNMRLGIQNIQILRKTKKDLCPYIQRPDPKSNSEIVKNGVAIQQIAVFYFGV
jgi:hypothetical protein